MNVSLFSCMTDLQHHIILESSNHLKKLVNSSSQSNYENRMERKFIMEELESWMHQLESLYSECTSIQGSVPHKVKVVLFFFGIMNFLSKRSSFHFWIWISKSELLANPCFKSIGQLSFSIHKDQVLHGEFDESSSRTFGEFLLCPFKTAFISTF